MRSGITARVPARRFFCAPQGRAAFSLLELAVVMVTIALVIGVIFAGRDMLESARLRAQVGQITQYRVAVADFKAIYGGQLPGDMKASIFNNLGFSAVSGSRLGTRGRGDGDGVLEGINWTSAVLPCNVTSGVISHLASGENAFFWQDLADNAKLIPGSFPKVQDRCLNPCCNNALYMPNARLGNGMSVYSYSKDQVNYLGVSFVSQIGFNGDLRLLGNARPGVSVAQAFGVDSKLDDGLPQSGAIVARYQNWSNQGGGFGNGEPRWAAGIINSTCGGVVTARSGACGSTWGATTAATAGSAETCYDNGNTAGAPMRYSFSINRGEGKNCGLSFQLE